jgi:hypothetical protein
VQESLNKIQERVSVQESLCSKSMHTLADLGKTNLQELDGLTNLYVGETQEVGYEIPHFF